MDGQVPLERDRRNTEQRRQLRRRITAEYRELAGLSLTPAQACRLFNITPSLCDRLIEELVTDGVLAVTAEGHLVRAEVHQLRANAET